MKAGGQAFFAATSDKEADHGNVTIRGSEIAAKNVLLEVAGKVKLLAGTDTDSTHSKTQSISEKLIFVCREIEIIR